MLRLHELVKVKQFDRYFARNVKNRSRIILRLWADHCEYIVAQRFRRGQQMLCLYRRLWDEQAFRGIIQRFRKQFERHARGIMFSSVGLAAAFDWDSERINYDSVRKHFDELELVKRLRAETIFCENCRQRRVIDCKLEGTAYCACPNSNSKAVPAPKETSWQPYMERQDMIVWRREERPGMYAYKVYAAYNDVSAEDFLHVQTDTEYRKIWDKTAITLDVIDSDPVHKNKSHIIYWEMLWPKLFANRDYVFNRRYFVDRNRKLIIIVNKSTTHPSCPKKPNNQRVSDYWSVMVIRPTSNSFKTPGVEYALTYFDNPGIVMPSAVTSWVAQKQMPDFLNKMHLATIEYAQTRRDREQYEEKTSKKCEYLPDPGYEYPPEPGLRFHYYKMERDVEDDDEDEDDVDDHEETRDNNNNNNNNNSNNNSNHNSKNTSNTNSNNHNENHRNESRSAKDNKSGSRNSTSEHKQSGQTDRSRSPCDAADDAGKLSTTANITKNQSDFYDDDDQTSESTADGAVSGKQSTSWWRYLLPFHYFM